MQYAQYLLNRKVPFQSPHARASPAWLMRSRKHGLVGSHAVKGCRNVTRHERRKMVSSSDTSVRMSKPRALNFGKCTKIALHSQAI